jgi:hypothetical protein
MLLCEFNMPQKLDRALQIAASRPDIHTACLVSNRSHKNTPKDTKLEKVCLRIAQRLTSWPGNRLRKCNIFWLVITGNKDELAETHCEKDKHTNTMVAGPTHNELRQ